MIATTEKEITLLRESGRRLAETLQAVVAAAHPGASTDELHTLAVKLLKEKECTPSLLGYKPDWAPRPYPAAMCVSINDEVVHGIPNEHPRELKDGDIVSFDLTIAYQGLITDSTVSIGIGAITPQARELLEVTEQAMYAGIDAVRVGNTVGDIGYAVEQVGRPHGYGIFTDIAGHGVGRKVHEEPTIPNVGVRGRGPKLKAGMVLAIEPMFSLGSSQLRLKKDGYTYVTRDGSLATHFEHTVLLTPDGPEILTKV